MKTALVALYEVYPPASGAASVSYHLARHLPGEVVLFQMMRGRARTEAEGEVRMVEFPYASDRHLLKVLSICRRLPGIVGAMKSERPEAIVLEGASWAVYLLLVFAFLRIRGVRSPIIYHSHNVEYLLRKTRNGPLVSLITRWAERTLCRRSDLTTAVSPADARAIEMLYGLIPVVISNGVDLDLFDVPPDEAARVASKYGITDRTVLFMGLSDYPPNREAIVALVSRIFPAALRSVPSLKLAIIGGRIPVRRDWLLNPGSIPYAEVPAFVKACRLCVAPIRSGSGTRVKLLEYMAAGRPVVSTSKGAEGLGAISGLHLLIADSDEAFADEIVRLVCDSVLSETLGRQARLFVRERFSWQVIADRLAREIRNLTLNKTNNSSRAGSTERIISHE
jgi:glycosyltransferase involved in cell wall biosynthesis